MSTSTDAFAVPPLVVEALEAIWRGEATGFSEAELRAGLADYQQTLADLHARRITPRRVVGRGGTKTLAVAWLTSLITGTCRDLSSRGRTNSCNRSNARFHAREAVTDPHVLELKAERDRTKTAADAAWVEARRLYPDPNDFTSLRHPPFLQARRTHEAAARAWCAAAEAVVTAQPAAT